MFTINDDMSIYVTRGDIVFFEVTAGDDDEKYIFQPGDVVRMKVTEKKDCEAVVFQKDFPVTAAAETVGILLTEEETKIGDVISKPTDFWYEIELNPFTNPQTIVGYDEEGAKIFKLFPEGKDVEETTVTQEDIPVVDKELSLTSERPVENQAVTRAITDLEDKVYTLNGRFNIFATLKEGSTTADAELADVRLGADGNTYNSAGEAVRGQFRQLMDAVDEAKADLKTPVEEAAASAAKAKESEKIAVENAETAQSSAEEIVENQKLVQQYAKKAEDAAGRAEAVAGFSIDTKLSEESYNPIANKAVAEAMKNVDAKTLDGYGVEYFAPLADVNKLSHTFRGEISVSDFNEVVEGGTYYCSVQSDAVNTPQGTYNGFLTVDVADKKIYHTFISSYDFSTIKRVRKNATEWTEWDTDATLAYLVDKLEKYLPKTGGTVKASYMAPIALENTNSDISLTAYKGKSVLLGYLGMSELNKPCFQMADGTRKDLLHTGNYSDYVEEDEEGTFELISNATDLLLVGNYYRVGKLVYAYAEGELSNSWQEEPYSVTGLPFTVSNKLACHMYLSPTSALTLSRLDNYILGIEDSGCIQISPTIEAGTKVAFLAIYLTND